MILYSYEEDVLVRATGVEEPLGTARFQGTAFREPASGRMEWHGDLTHFDFEAGIIMNYMDLVLEFKDGASGRALCRNLSFVNTNWQAELLGTGPAPRATVN